MGAFAIICSTDNLLEDYKLLGNRFAEPGEIFLVIGVGYSKVLINDRAIKVFCLKTNAIGWIYALEEYWDLCENFLPEVFIESDPTD